MTTNPSSTTTTTTNSYFYTKPLEYISKDRHTVTAFLTCSRTIFHSSIIPYILMSGNNDRYHTNHQKDQINSPPSNTSFQYELIDEPRASPHKNEEVLGFSTTLWKNLAFVTKFEQNNVEHQEKVLHGSSEEIQQYDAIFYEDAEERLIKIFNLCSTLQFTSSICTYSLNAVELRAVLFDHLFDPSSSSCYFPKMLRSFTYHGSNVGMVLKTLLENCEALEYLDISYCTGWPHFFNDYLVVGADHNDKGENEKDAKKLQVKMKPTLTKTMKYLDLSGCFVKLTEDDQVVYDFLKNFPSLETLKFHKVTSISVEFIDQALIESNIASSLTYLSLPESKFETAAYNPTTEQTTTRETHPFCVSRINPQNFPLLQHISLRDSQYFVNTGVEELKSIGSLQGQLRTLDLRGCVDLCDKAMIESLTVTLFSHLTHLNLNCCSKISGKTTKNCFKNFLRLKYLSLMGCDLSDDEEGTDFLEQAQNPNLYKTLEYLNFASCSKIGGKTAERLAKYTNLRFLCIGEGNCPIPDESYKKLKNLTKIETLILTAADEISDETLIEWLSKCTRLKKLTIENAQKVTSKTLEMLGMRTRMSKNKKTTDGNEIEEAFEHLEELLLFGCSGIHDVSSIGLLTGLKYLEV